MFDIGGMELLLIFIIILVVAGPERLPGIIKTIGRWTGYARRTVNQFKRDFEDEFEVAELRKEFKASTQMEELTSLQKDIKDIGKDIDKEFDEAEKSFKQLQDDAKDQAKSNDNSANKSGPAKPLVADANADSDSGSAGATSAAADEMPEPPRYSGEELVRMAAVSRGIDPDADEATMDSYDLPELANERARKAAEAERIADNSSPTHNSSTDKDPENGGGAVS